MATLKVVETDSDLYLESPLYVAITLWVPDFKLGTLRVALPELILTVYGVSSTVIVTFPTASLAILTTMLATSPYMMLSAATAMFEDALSTLNWLDVVLELYFPSPE